ncbi:helix-turn-helix domain-containing protein [Okeania sp. SIO2F5]|uniref:helix-turn-helix domain-containing protein n=1 Tax=Okeania sp. SIO2F5 TaxID=2607794 RepID=UPI00338E14B0
MRERALDLIINGMSISHVSRLLNISRPTLHQWRDIAMSAGIFTNYKNCPIAKSLILWFFYSPFRSCCLLPVACAQRYTF